MLFSIRLSAMMFVLVLFLAGCEPTVSDTGHLGTWERQIASGVFSRISLWEEGGETHFCWSTRGKGRGERARCAGGGITETVVDREVVFEYRFTVSPGDNDDELLVDVEGVPRDGRSTPIRWTDRIVVQPGGIELWSYKISLNGTELAARVPLRFTKVADGPI